MQTKHLHISVGKVTKVRMSTNITNKVVLKRGDLLYPELRYKVVGVLFSVFNELGYGYRERYYQQAVTQEFLSLNLHYEKEIRFPVLYKGKKIGSHVFDFLVDNKIIIELKQGDYFSKNDIKQAVDYLKNSGLRLAILARFTRRGLKYKRIINLI